MKGLTTMVSLRKFCSCSLVWTTALFLMCGLAEATPLYENPLTITAAAPTQLGRLSRNGVPQGWSGGEAFPGTINPAVSYHYTTLDLDLGALEAPYVSYGGFIQINFESTSTFTFLSAYLDAYSPANKATNWLGDAGFSGDAFGTDTVFFQVVVPVSHHLVMVLNETTPNAGLNFAPTDLLIEAFTDTEFTDLTPRAATVPEPGSLELLLCGMVLLAAHRFRRGAAA
jgi:PEP-CTERM motif-containing protein